MIQDIAPYQINNAYVNSSPMPNNLFFLFDGQKVLLYASVDGQFYLPAFQNLGLPQDNLKGLTTYLFSIDNQPLYLIKNQSVRLPNHTHLRYREIHTLNYLAPSWLYFAGITAWHLSQWYDKHTFCGRCGNAMADRREERALVCNKCGNVEYPQIAPVVMVAVVNQDKLLLTKYADRQLSQWVLISGFVEIGESLEEAAQREVFEETGLRIKNLRYFGSQPWGFSSSLIAGYMAEVYGSDTISLDCNELSEAIWCPRGNLPAELTDISLTYEMMEAFRRNNF